MHDIFVIICIEFFWVKKKMKFQVIVFVIYIYYRYNPFCIKFFNYCIILVTLFGSFYLMPMFLQTTVQTNDNEDNSKTFDIDVCNKN